MTIGHTLPSDSGSLLGAAVSPGTESGGYGAVSGFIDWIVSADRGALDRSNGRWGWTWPALGVAVPDMDGDGRAEGSGVEMDGWTRAKP